MEITIDSINVSFFADLAFHSNHFLCMSFACMYLIFYFETPFIALNIQLHAMRNLTLQLLTKHCQYICIVDKIFKK